MNLLGHHGLLMNQAAPPDDGCAPYSPGAATGQTFVLGPGLYVDDNFSSPTGGAFHLCNEIT